MPSYVYRHKSEVTRVPKLKFKLKSKLDSRANYLLSMCMTVTKPVAVL